MRDATAACQGPPDNAHDKEGEIFQWPVCVCFPRPGLAEGRWQEERL